MTARVRLTALAGILVLLVACGVRADSSPRDLAADDVPYGLLDEGPPLPTTTIPRIEQVNVAVYFIERERLQPVPRVVSDPPSPGRAVAALMEGPTDEEAVGGLRTAINPTTEATVTRVTADIVQVDLTTEFAAVPTPEQRLALGQIVYTATGIPGVVGVRFTVAGAPVGVLLPDGTVTSEPVTRDAFPSLAPEGSTPNQPA